MSCQSMLSRVISTPDFEEIHMLFFYIYTMPSLISGYQYDIFISYRQKDNKGDRWVTHFVDALKIELEATFKDDVSIYFDENPHDGLLETYDVGESLKEKLRCLIFIPIISQTYCDPKSFAWQHEFIAFREMATAQTFGLKVKLANGNITSRILPVRIHELDAEDILLLEREVGFLRSIDFIYKSAGVNRALKSHEDNPQDNLNKTYYRDQINKVANAIKEIIIGVRASTAGTTPISPKEKPFVFPGRSIFAKSIRTRKMWRLMSVLLSIIVALSAAYYFARPYLVKTKKVGIAILPFRDISSDKDHDVYGAGMASEIRTTLSESKYFDFISSMQATMPFVNTNLSPKQIGKELRVDYLLSGFYQVSGNTIKVDVELVDKLGNAIWDLSIQNELTDIFKTQENISSQVLGKFSSIQIENSHAKSEGNLDAYVHCQKGNSILLSISAYDSASLTPAIEQYQRALAIDSLYEDAWLGLVNCESRLVDRNPLNDYRKKSLRKHVAYVNDNLAASWRTDLINAYYYYFGQEDLTRGLKLALDVLEKNPENLSAIEIAGSIYKRNLNHRQSIFYAEKALDLEPASILAWDQLAQSLQVMGDYKNCLRAHIKKWQLGADNSEDILWEAGALGSLDDIPQELIRKTDTTYTFAKYKLERNLKEALKLARTNKDYLIRAEAYMMAGMKDSSYYWGNQQVAALLKDDNKNNFAFATAYGYAGNREKALEHLDKITWFKHPGIWQACIKQHFTVWILIATGNYEEATKNLVKINKEYPAFGDYGQFKNDAYYDLPKAKYPPFAEAVNNLKLPEKVVLRKPIVLSGDTRISQK